MSHDVRLIRRFERRDCSSMREFTKPLGVPLGEAVWGASALPVKILLEICRIVRDAEGANGNLRRARREARRDDAISAGALSLVKAHVRLLVELLGLQIIGGITGRDSQADRHTNVRV